MPCIWNFIYGKNTTFYMCDAFHLPAGFYMLDKGPGVFFEPVTCTCILWFIHCLTPALWYNCDLKSRMWFNKFYPKLLGASPLLLVLILNWNLITKITGSWWVKYYVRGCYVIRTLITLGNFRQINNDMFEVHEVLVFCL